jgi:hypothetical protein
MEGRFWVWEDVLGGGLRLVEVSTQTRYALGAFAA